MGLGLAESDHEPRTVRIDAPLFAVLGPVLGVAEARYDVGELRRRVYESLKAVSADQRVQELVSPNEPSDRHVIVLGQMFWGLERSENFRELTLPDKRSGSDFFRKTWTDRLKVPGLLPTSSGRARERGANLAVAMAKQMTEQCEMQVDMTGIDVECDKEKRPVRLVLRLPAAEVKPSEAGPALEPARTPQLVVQLSVVVGDEVGTRAVIDLPLGADLFDLLKGVVEGVTPSASEVAARSRAHSFDDTGSDCADARRRVDALVRQGRAELRLGRVERATKIVDECLPFARTLAEAGDEYGVRLFHGLLSRVAIATRDGQDAAAADSIMRRGNKIWSALWKVRPTEVSAGGLVAGLIFCAVNSWHCGDARSAFEFSSRALEVIEKQESCGVPVEDSKVVGCHFIHSGIASDLGKWQVVADSATLAEVMNMGVKDVLHAEFHGLLLGRQIRAFENLGLDKAELFARGRLIEHWAERVSDDPADVEVRLAWLEVMRDRLARLLVLDGVDKARADAQRLKEELDSIAAGARRDAKWGARWLRLVAVAAVVLGAVASDSAIPWSEAMLAEASVLTEQWPDDVEVAVAKAMVWWTHAVLLADAGDSIAAIYYLRGAVPPLEAWLQSNPDVDKRVILGPLRALVDLLAEAGQADEAVPYRLRVEEIEALYPEPEQ